MSVVLSSYKGVERDECLVHRVPSHVEFRADVSSLNMEDRSEAAVEDHSNCLILVNRNDVVKFGRRHIVIDMVGIGMVFL